MVFSPVADDRAADCPTVVSSARTAILGVDETDALSLRSRSGRELKHPAVRLACIVDARDPHLGQLVRLRGARARRHAPTDRRRWARSWLNASRGTQFPGESSCRPKFPPHGRRACPSREMLVNAWWQRKGAFASVGD